METTTTMKRLLLILAIILPTFTFAQDFVIDHYDIGLVIATDGSIEVAEVIDVTFSKRKRGIFREIPYSYIVDGEKISLGVTDIDVSDSKYKVSRKNGHHVIRIGSKDRYVNGKQQYKINYKIRNGIQSYGTHQEFYYDLIGDRWRADIAELTYEVRLPKSVTIAQADLQGTTGRRGKQVDGITIGQKGSTLISGTTSRVLTEGEGASIAIKFPINYLTVADLAQNNYVAELKEKEKQSANQNPWLALLPAGLFGFFGLFRKWIGTGNRVKNKGQRYHYPPDGLTSAHVGAFIDQKAHTRDLVSLIPYWATEGYLRMESLENDTKLTKVLDLDPSFPSYEHLLFDGLFEEGDSASMSDLSTSFQKSLHHAKKELTTEVIAQGYYDDKFSYWFRSWRTALFPMLMIVLAVVSFVIFKQTLLVIGCIVAALASLLYSTGKQPLSEYGAEVKASLDGLQDYIKNASDDEVAQLLRDDPKYFDKMLPFAVAFGLENNFIPKFESSMNSMPMWYTTHNGSQSFSDFGSSFDTEVINSAFSPAPPTSRGSSGGGFSSGGGIGGGGGGSW